MKCPKCGALACRVVYTVDKDTGIHRRRECIICGHRFSTKEIVYKPIVGRPKG
jgi:transcriptional regulator NrdR family protein